MFTDYEKNIIITLKSDMIKTVTAVLHSMPPGLAYLIQKGIVTGGITASLLHHKKYNDIDVYLKDSDTITEFSNLVKSNFMDWVEDEKVYSGLQSTQTNKKVITANAITFKNKIQVITMANADHRKTFDFIHCMPWLNLSDNKFYISEEQYASISKKELIRNPNGGSPTAYRCEKYIKRGWTTNEFNKLCER